MSSIRQKIIDNGRIPLMSKEGVSELVRVSTEFLRNGQIELKDGRVYRGYNTTRIIRLEGHKESPPNEHVDESFISETRCAVLCAILKKLREEKDINKVRQGIARVFSSAAYMSDDEIRAIINTPDEILYGYFVEGKGSMPEALKTMYEEYTHHAEHAGGREELPYECVSGNSANNTYRIYMNLPQNKTTYEFWKRFRIKCVERGVSYDAKTSNSEGGGITLDGQIIYVAEEEADIVLGILEELAVEIPEITEVAGTPISGAVQYSYYSIANAKIQGGNTYNNACNSLTMRAYYIAVAREILKDSEYCSKLTPRQLECLQIVANYENHKPEVANGEISQIGGKILLNRRGVPDNVSDIVTDYVRTHNVEDVPGFEAGFEEILLKLFSCFNYGDFEHTDMPIALPKEFYEGMDMSAPKRESKATPKSTAAPKTATTSAKPKKSFASMNEREQAKAITENVDDAFIVLLNEYLNTCDADPVLATKILLFKLSQLKKQYMEVAEANGLVGTPKYEHMMNMFSKFEQFPMYKLSPAKSARENKEDEKRYYEGLAPRVKGLAGNVRTVLSSFDKREDKELAEAAEAETKSNETEKRKQLIENIVDIMLEIFKEFNDNFNADPAKATEIFLTKLAQLRREYVVAASFIGGTKTTQQHQLVMKAFERFKDNPVYTGDSSGKRQYYENIAWDVRRDAQVVANKLDMFDVKD